MTVQLVASSTTRGDTLARAGGLRYVPVLAFGIDLFLVTTSVILAIIGRETLPSSPLEVGDSLTVFGPAMVFAWIALMFALGAYRRQVFGAGTDEYKRVVNGTLLTFGVVGIIAYLMQFPLSRGFFLMAVAIGIPTLVFGRFVLRRSLQRARRHGALQHRVLIAGTPGHVDEIASVLNREKWLGYDVVGAVTPEPVTGRATASGVPVIASSDALALTAIGIGADIVFLAGGAFDSAADLRRLSWDLEHVDIEVVIAPSVTDVSAERVSIRPVGGMPLIHLEKPRAQEAVRRAKRLFDIVGSAGLLIAFAPVFAVAAFAVWWHDRGPVYFRQQRVGRDGRVFDVLKVRTMVTDAEARLAAVKEAHDFEGVLFKMEDDPRVTPPGRWLRRYSLDELPQLVNVLKGDMSLVGPRPPLDHEVAQYDADMRQRLRVRPGMTGLWQVSGRSDLSWSEAIRLDLYYTDNWSMLQDLTILFRTFSAVFGSRGAY